MKEKKKEKKKEGKKRTSERILGYFLSDWLSRVEHTIKASVSLLLSLLPLYSSLPLRECKWEEARRSVIPCNSRIIAYRMECIGSD